MIKNYKLLLIMIACFMFPIACNEMCTKLSVSGVDKVCVCTCDKRNKKFCSTLTILTPELIKFFFVKGVRRIMRDIFRKKHRVTKRPFNPLRRAQDRLQLPSGRTDKIFKLKN